MKHEPYQTSDNGKFWDYNFSIDNILYNISVDKKTGHLFIDKDGN